MSARARMRPSADGYICYMIAGSRGYIGRGVTMEAAYEDFFRHEGLDLACLGNPAQVPEHCLPTSKLPWWKRLFRV